MQPPWSVLFIISLPTVHPLVILLFKSVLRTSSILSNFRAVLEIFTP
jgi:hypothetical protein